MGQNAGIRGGKWSTVVAIGADGSRKGRDDMFLGTHMQKLDDKGRLILPAKFREVLSPGLVLTRGQENCLTLFPTTEFEAEHARIQNAPKTNKEARDYQRVFLSAAFADQPDKQGRITVPNILRQYAS